MLHNPPEVHNFVSFALRWNGFELRAMFPKSAPNDPNWPWHYVLHTPQRPKVSFYFTLLWAFLSYAPFSEKCAVWRQMTLTCSRSKMPICMLHTPWGPKYHPFRSMMSPFRATLLSWLEIKFTFSRSKIPICKLHTPKKPRFSSVSFYGEPFLSYAPFFRKIALNDPK